MELLRQSTEELMSAPRKAYDLAVAACEISGTDPESIEHGKSLHSLGLALTFLGRYAEALEALEGARRTIGACGATDELARVLNSIGNARHRTGDAAGALRAYREGAALLEKAGKHELEVMEKIRCNIALIYRGIGDYEKSSKILLDLLRRYDDRQDIQAAVILDNLGSIYAELGDFERSSSYLHRALERSRRDGYLYGQAMTLGNLGSICNDWGRLREGLEYLTEALDICEKISDRDGIARTLHNIGICYDLQERYGQALRYLRRASREALAIGNTRSHAYSLAAIGGIYRKTGKPHQAISALEQALRAARDISEAMLEYQIHEELADAYENAGDIARALHHHRRYAELRERVQGEETRRTIAELQIRFDLERAEQEREIYRLRSEQLEKDLRIKTGELTAMALRLVQRSEMLGSVKEGIAEVLRAQNGSAHPTLHSVLHTVEGESHIDEWHAFDQQFRRVHPDYIRALSARYPALSPTELKICALLKINLNSKEIARLLHVSLRDIENHRYRIRKKLGLSSGENLASFLAGI